MGASWEYGTIVQRAVRFLFLNTLRQTDCQPDDRSPQPGGSLRSCGRRDRICDDTRSGGPCRAIVVSRIGRHAGAPQVRLRVGQVWTKRTPDIGSRLTSG